MSEVRTFDTGATRDQDDNKHDPEGFLSPLVVRRYNAYMHKHRYQADGTVRQSDNWQKGMPLDVFMKSGWRHFLDWWTLHRGHAAVDADGQPVDIEEAICAVLFNASGALHEILAAKARRKSHNLTDAQMSELLGERPYWDTTAWHKPVETNPVYQYIEPDSKDGFRRYLSDVFDVPERLLVDTPKAVFDNLDHHRPGDCPACDPHR